MKLANGAKSWLILPSFGIAICFIAALFSQEIIQSFFIFLTIMLFLFLLFLIMFFRDPERAIGKGLVAVADGRIRSIQMENDNDIGQCMFISTFMNVYNVHVNRSPIDGIVKKVIHHPGSHLPAFTKESKRNERREVERYFQKQKHGSTF